MTTDLKKNKNTTESYRKGESIVKSVEINILNAIATEGNRLYIN